MTDNVKDAADFPAYKTMHNAEVQIQNWTCGYEGLCRRFCFDQEYIVGHHGCPRRYRCVDIKWYIRFIKH
ncbi:beta-defensin-like 2 [Garra rufa]|uniref:beta-defensin-like 2 n=1 Tax=Garra rufa TaxID=137080 RepID=UPI003CCE92D0